jgi:hypothetical protein
MACAHTYDPGKYIGLCAQRTPLVLVAVDIHWTRLYALCAQYTPATGPRNVWVCRISMTCINWLVRSAHQQDPSKHIGLCAQRTHLVLVAGGIYWHHRPLLRAQYTDAIRTSDLCVRRMSMTCINCIMRSAHKCDMSSMVCALSAHSCLVGRTLPERSTCSISM